MLNINNIQIKNLYVYFNINNKRLKIIDGIDLLLEQGNFTAIIGESGCGKSILGQAILGILPQNTSCNGEIIYKKTNILFNSDKTNNSFGKEFEIVPQNPEAAFNPIRKITKQMDDILSAADIKEDKNFIKKKYLKLFGMEKPERVLQCYPHELSGGMQQRVLCAMSVMTRPKWILADEPTKGMDEKLCRIVYDNLLLIKKENFSSMIIITHDILLAAKVCDTIAVMYSGQILEVNDNLLNNPKHPYTKLFLKALPEKGLNVIPGKAPVPGEIITGCKFAARCPYCMRLCVEQKPPVYNSEGVLVRCFLYA